MGDAVVTVHIRDEHAEEKPGAELREKLDARCRELAAEFPEVSRLEVTLEFGKAGIDISGHATGKATDAAVHAQGKDALHALGLLVDKLRHQLRREHDKRIFAHRREAQHQHPRRS